MVGPALLADLDSTSSESFGWYDDGSTASGESATPAEAEKPSYSCGLVGLGAGYRRLFDIPVYLAQGSFAGGACTPAGGDYFAFDLLFGKTPAGLNVVEVGLGYRADFRLDDWVLGFRGRAATVRIQRRSRSDWLNSWGPGIALPIGWDLTHSPRFGLELEPSADWMIGQESHVLLGCEPLVRVSRSARIASSKPFLAPITLPPKRPARTLSASRSRQTPG